MCIVRVVTNDNLNLNHNKISMITWFWDLVERGPWWENNSGKTLHSAQRNRSDSSKGVKYKRMIDQQERHL